ncbi:hypothetical protein H9Q70_009873 [Fusarium xylarioides]|nr:hypothetical protein H9Q70_009873 [Fusarium xylarioides]KAG5774730.1 hypothetical protein H9Q73_011597 [Fusarium xylarioides]
MRWISIAAVLGAALLPASARPLCRPDRSTTTGLPSTTATTSVETMSTESATATETSAIETTVTFVTTFTESETATATTVFTTVSTSAASEAATTTQYDVDDSEAVGGNQLNQTVNGLDTERLYRLTTYATVFNTPAPVKDESTICVIQALQESTTIAQWRLDFTDLGTYKPYHVDFTPFDEDVTVTMRLRCSDGKKVTLSVGLDDVSLYDIGPKLVG